MKDFLLLFAPALANLVTGFMDAYISEQGFAKGYTEANSIINKLFGPKPNFAELEAYNLFYVILFLGVQILGFHNMAILGACLGGQLANAGLHVRAYYTWKTAFATNGASLVTKKSIWQKLFW
jgi:hypothetical protein